MRRLLKADLFRVIKSRLTLIALILAVAFPVLIVLMYAGIGWISGFEEDFPGGSLFNANFVISSVYSLTNNIGLVIPAFAGILVCLDVSNGTLRNKVIAGNRRSTIYLSHLIVSILFSVLIITVYAALTAVLALLFFPFNTDSFQNLGLEILYFVANGTMSFVYIATVTTMLALTMRNVAPTIIFTIVFSIALMALNSIVMLVDYTPYKYAVYFIPTFGGNFFTLNGGGLLGLLNPTTDASKELIFAESMISYLFFSMLHTVIGLLIFKKRDLR